MAQLFEETSINGMRLANRFVRSATWEGLAYKDGTVSPRLTQMMVALAEGEVGLIITGYAFVSSDGQSSPGQLAVYDDHFLPGLWQMTEAVHGAGGKIALQIVHGGHFANPELTGKRTIGPSVGEKFGQAMSEEDIADIVSAFKQAAARAKLANFDAVQVHAAHGFLLSQFLSPEFNQRTDDYGGSLENRARFLIETVHGVRKAVGRHYPVLVKLNSEDFLDNGMTQDDMIQVAGMLKKASVNAIELSGGTVASENIFLPARPGELKAAKNEVYYREAAILYKKKMTIPLMLVGGIRSNEVAEALVREGIADYISLARPLIAESGLVRRWREGDRRKAECVSCNLCFGTAGSGKGIYCVPMSKKSDGSSD